MDPISIAPLAISVWKLIAPYAKKVGSKLVEKTGEAMPEVLDKLWDTVKTKMESKPETQTLPADMTKAPDDEDIQGAFKYQLKKLLENDEAFAKRLDDMVKEVAQTTSYSADMSGDGAIAQGNNAVAVGRGGVHIGGYASDNAIIAGNSNAINAGKKRRKKK